MNTYKSEKKDCLSGRMLTSIIMEYHEHSEDAFDYGIEKDKFTSADLIRIMKYSYRPGYSERAFQFGITRERCFTSTDLIKIMMTCFYRHKFIERAFELGKTEKFQFTSANIVYIMKHLRIYAEEAAKYSFTSDIQFTDADFAELKSMSCSKKLNLKLCFRSIDDCIKKYQSHQIIKQFFRNSLYNLGLHKCISNICSEYL